MILGFLQVYNEVDWIEYSIDHAMSFCDKLIIIEGSQFSQLKKIPERSNDGTLEIINQKIEEYPNSIELEKTSRKFSNYRENQAVNFNFALSKCDIGDYFAPLDADQFYFKNYIEKIKEVSDEGKIDFSVASGIVLGFSFNWRIIINDLKFHTFNALFKKNPKLNFIPTHTPLNHGKNKVIDEEGESLIHYMWVKPKERISLRLKTARHSKEIVRWFKKNWDKIELVDNNKVNYYKGSICIKKYNGPHPEILKNHPWRQVDDLRLF